MKINVSTEDILNERQYYQQGEDLEAMFMRVAKCVAGAERKHGHSEQFIDSLTEQYYEAQSNQEFLPSSPFYMNAGTEVQMLSACFVCGIEDNMESIFDTLKKAALIHKDGGGTGFDFSKLRHKGAIIKSTGGTSSGVLSFARLYDLEGEIVKQGGKRRAANMGALRVDHPEILSFIDAKRNEGVFENFNFSVLIPNWFMEKVQRGETYDLMDYNGYITETLNARDVFKRIVKNNWESGEPGILYIDNINQGNKLKHLGLITVTNPCGEVPLLPWEACTLGSINLDKIVIDGSIDWEKLEDLVRLGVRFLDSSIDVNKFPLPEITEAVMNTRKIGLGVMGLHSMLIRLGIKYNSAEGRSKAGEVLEFMREVAIDTSIDLANKKGVPKGWYGSDWEREGIKLRNLCLLSIAPTGTITMIANSPTAGAEPAFPWVQERIIMDRPYKIINPLLEELGRQEGWFSDNLIDSIIRNKGSVQGITTLPKKWRDLMLIGGEVSPEDHVLMQSTLQRHVDLSISKTVNMPETATIEDVERVYMLAHREGCKGITIYRENSRRGVIRTIKINRANTGDPKDNRPEVLIGVTMKVASGCGKLWVTINPFDGKIWEIFASTGSDGGCTSNIQQISRLSSLACREGIPVERVIDQLRSVPCSKALANRKCDVSSCSDAIAKQMETFLEIYNPVEWDKFMKTLFKKLDSRLDQSDSYEKDYNRMAGCKSGTCEF